MDGNEFGDDSSQASSSQKEDRSDAATLETIAANLQTLGNRLEGLGSRLEGKIDSLKSELEGKIDSLKSELDERLRMLERELSYVKVDAAIGKQAALRSNDTDQYRSLGGREAVRPQTVPASRDHLGNFSIRKPAPPRWG